VAKQVLDLKPDVRFVLVGDGEMRTRVESLIARYHLNDRIYLAGWRRDIPAVMQALDAFLLTSHWEGLPRVLIEARVVGLPIVATNVGGAGEVMDDTAIGTLCEAGDIRELASAIGRILSCRTTGSDGRTGEPSRLPREFHIDETVLQYERLYDRLLGLHQGGIVPQTTH
jgi:glycosyltransferase involved in cell wall biosynthesis